MADRANFDTTSHQMVQAIVTVLAVITPVVCGSIFLTLTANLQSRQKWQAAVHVALSILVILVASAFVGLPVLGVFGISRVPHRRWAHHRVYGVRHAGRRAQGGASAAVLGDARPAARAVRMGLGQLSKARAIISSTPDVLGGTAVFKGTRIPVHDIADMLANGDRPAAIIKAFPQLDADRVRLAGIYASAYPARGRPRAKARRSRIPKASETLAFADLGRL